MRIELLYFDGCPHYAPLERRLRSLLATAAVDARVVLREVRSQEEAERQSFLGSPTVRIDGRDVEPGADGRTDTGLKCRLYPGERGLRGAPDDDVLIEAIERARSRRDTRRAHALPSRRYPAESAFATSPKRRR